MADMVRSGPQACRQSHSKGELITSVLTMTGSLAFSLLSSTKQYIIYRIDFGDEDNTWLMALPW